MKKIIMYSSPDCCLCDDAMQVFEHFDRHAEWELVKQNIFTDKSLLIKYRFTIPVLHEVATNTELNWPFDLKALEQWLNKP